MAVLAAARAGEPSETLASCRCSAHKKGVAHKDSETEKRAEQKQQSWITSSFLSVLITVERSPRAACAVVGATRPSFTESWAKILFNRSRRSGTPSPKRVIGWPSSLSLMRTSLSSVGTRIVRCSRPKRKSAGDFLVLLLVSQSFVRASVAWSKASCCSIALWLSSLSSIVSAPVQEKDKQAEKHKKWKGRESQARQRKEEERKNLLEQCWYGQKQ